MCTTRMGNMKIIIIGVALFFAFSIGALAQINDSIPPVEQREAADTNNYYASYREFYSPKYIVYYDFYKGSFISKLGIGVYNIDHATGRLFYYYGLGAGYNFDYEMPEIDTYLGINYHLSLRIRAHTGHDMDKFNFSYTPEIGFGLSRGFAMIGYRIWVVNPNEIKNEYQFHFSFAIPYDWYN